MNRQRILIGALILAVLLSPTASPIVRLSAPGKVLAQEPDPPAGQGEGQMEVTATVSTAFTYQGRLTDGGSPANGTYDFQFTLCDALSSAQGGGAAAEEDTSVAVAPASRMIPPPPITKDDVTVTNGLFTVELNFGSVNFTGDARYLEIGVRPGSSTGAFTTLSPRQSLTATPYALSLVPGAKIEANQSGDVFRVINHGTGTSVYGENASTSGTSVKGWASAGSGTTYGVYGQSDSTSGTGVYGEASASSGTTYGVYGWSDSTAGTGVMGRASASSGTTRGVYGTSSSAGSRGVEGVWGTASSYAPVAGTGVFGNSSNGIGVAGFTNNGLYGVWGSSTGGIAGDFDNNTSDPTEPTLRLQNTASGDNGDLIRAFSSYNDLEFRVTAQGAVYADTGYYTPAADFAEMLPAQDGLGPGDVLVIGLDGELARSTEPYQASVVGVYSTQPGFVGGAGDGTDLTSKVPLAVVGIVQVKVSTESGPIRPGDLLTTSFIPGHAMKAGPNPPAGTVIGKALEELDASQDTGIIDMLVMLR